MFCTKCGQQMPEGSAFCTNCGSKMDAAEQTSQPAATPSAPNTASAPKKKTGLIVGLIAGGAVLIVAVVLLIVLLGGGNAALDGTWYETTGFGGTITFKSGNTFDIEVMGVTVSGSYTFDASSNSGEMTLESYDLGEFSGFEDLVDDSAVGETSSFYIEGESLYMDGAEYTREVVEQMDISDLFGDLDMSDFDFE